MQTIRITNSLIKRQAKWISIQSIWFLTCIFFAWFFAMFVIFFQATIKGTDFTVQYLEGNTYFHYYVTSQISFIMNPFLVTSTVFIALTFLSVIYFWFDYLTKHFYLTKLYQWDAVFDNAFFNQFLVYFLCFYIPLWLTICANYYSLDSAFSFYSANNHITAGAIVYCFFFILFTLYIEIICLFRINKDSAKDYLFGGVGMKKVLIFGVTGSIGKNTVKIIDQSQDEFKIVGATYNNNIDEMKSILDKHAHIKYYYSPSHKKLSNVNSYEEMIKLAQPDLIVNALTGIAGVEISLLAVRNHIDLALANKESLIAAGSLIMKEAAENNVKIYPVDSEHANLKLLIDAYKQENIKKLFITCSGGPFYNFDHIQLNNVTYQQAINHPTWKMGPKISVDSSTLMNKAFEMIEAFWLFNTTNIQPIYHPQSQVHAMIELKNNEIISGMSVTDMVLPIQLALNGFNTNKPLIKNMDFANLNLTFDYIDETKWEALQIPNLYFQNADTTLGTILCTLDEIAIEKFRTNQIKFSEIVPFIIKNYSHFKIEKLQSLEQIKNLQLEINTYFREKND